jgi:hypothetical protein
MNNTTLKTLCLSPATSRSASRDESSGCLSRRISQHTQTDSTSLGNDETGKLDRYVISNQATRCYLIDDVPIPKGVEVLIDGKVTISVARSTICLRTDTAVTFSVNNRSKRHDSQDTSHGTKRARD